MKTVILTLGDIGSVQEICTYTKSENKIIQEWKKRYGKKFYECIVTVIDDKKDDDLTAPPRKQVKLIINTRNGEMYEGYEDCISKTGKSHSHVWMQCRRKMYAGYDYWLKYA